MSLSVAAHILLRAEVSRKLLPFLSRDLSKCQFKPDSCISLESHHISLNLAGELALLEASRKLAIAEEEEARRQALIAAEEARRQVGVQ